MDEEKDLSEVAFYSFSNVRVSWKNCGKSLSPEHLQIVFPLPLQKNRTTALHCNKMMLNLGKSTPPPKQMAPVRNPQPVVLASTVDARSVSCFEFQTNAISLNSEVQ